MISGIVGILRSSQPINLVSTCRALQAGGISRLEITLNTPRALEGVSEVRAELPSVTIGAGTILRPEDAEGAIAAGAQFIVTPTLQPETVSLCRDKGVPILCGAMTPTEILAAHEAGADYVKLFPAGALGLDYIKTVLGPLPFVRFVPTGGVSLQNIGAFLDLCPAVGVGGNLVDVGLISAGRWDVLEERARQFLRAAAGERL